VPTPPAGHEAEVADLEVVGADHDTVADVLEQDRREDGIVAFVSVTVEARWRMAARSCFFTVIFIGSSP
jgi:hypothetical protein